MEPTIFTRIINGEIPCHKIYEDDRTIAFLDIHPDKPGHTLVVTKVQIDQYIDLSDEDYAALWQSVKKVATQLKSVLNTDRVKVIIVGTDVPHVHVHLVPFSGKNSDIDPSREAIEPDHAALAEMAQKLVF
jgi:histidine triad (HIT) family protein